MSARPSMPSERTWLPLVEFALEEDLGPGDATSALVVDAERSGGAVIEARESLVVCGLSVAEAVFAELDPDTVFTPGCDDGAQKQQIADLTAQLAACERKAAAHADARAGWRELGEVVGYVHDPNAPPDPVVIALDLARINTSTLSISLEGKLTTQRMVDALEKEVIDVRNTFEDFRATRNRLRQEIVRLRTRVQELEKGK